jgi:hypothetical protein
LSLGLDTLLPRDKNLLIPYRIHPRRQKIFYRVQVPTRFLSRRYYYRFWDSDTERSGYVGNIGPCTAGKRAASFNNPLKPTSFDKVGESTAVPVIRQNDVQSI